MSTSNTGLNSSDFGMKDCGSRGRQTVVSAMFPSRMDEELREDELDALYAQVYYGGDNKDGESPVPVVPTPLPKKRAARDLSASPEITVPPSEAAKRRGARVRSPVAGLLLFTLLPEVFSRGRRRITMFQLPGRRAHLLRLRRAIESR